MDNYVLTNKLTKGGNMIKLNEFVGMIKSVFSMANTLLTDKDKKDNTHAIFNFGISMGMLITMILLCLSLIWVIPIMFKLLFLYSLLITLKASFFYVLIIEGKSDKSFPIEKVIWLLNPISDNKVLYNIKE